MDMTWWDNFDGDYWHDFILHLERENSLKKDLETLEKLFDERESVPQNVIGIMNVKNATRIDDLITEAKDRCNINNALLIFKTNSLDNNKEYFDEVHAYILIKNAVKQTKIAYVSDIAGTLYMRFDHKLEENI
jgi:hypothetical protein